MVKQYFSQRLFIFFFSVLVTFFSYTQLLIQPAKAATIPLTITIEGANPHGSGGSGIVYANSPWLTIWFKSDASQPSFDLNAHYQVHFEEPNCTFNCTYDAYPNSDNQNLNSAHQLVAHINANGQFNAGNWSYKLGLNDTTDANLIYQGTFTVFPAGGKNGIPALELPNGNVIKNSDTNVPIYILNTDSNTSWSVWVGGDHTPLYTVTNNPNGGDIHGKGDFSGESGGPHQLCMTNSVRQLHGVATVNGLSCDYSIDIDITPLGPSQPGPPAYSNQPGTPNSTTTTTSTNNVNTICNPACGPGLTCMNSFDLASNTSGGNSFNQSSGAFSFTNIFGGSNICVPITPTPSSCIADSNCMPYTCDTKTNKCTTTPMPSPTAFNTPDPLCPQDRCQTALGIIPTQPTAFIAQILVIILSFAGGIAILLIINSGYHIMVSGGNPEKLQEAREGLTSALVGLLFIIFSVAILQFIAYSVLRIPGFGQ